MSDPVHDYLAEIGRKGGAAGRGPAKARTSKQAQAAARARWGKRKKREMFAKLSPACTGRYPLSGTCKWRRDMTDCTQRNCPLLKKDGER